MGKQVEGERGKKRGAGPPPFGCFLLRLPSPFTPAMQAKDRILKINQLLFIRDPSVVRNPVSNHLNYFIFKFRSGMGRRWGVVWTPWTLPLDQPLE